jgi:hypothetical protein
VVIPAAVEEEAQQVKALTPVLAATAAMVTSES